ISQAEGKTVREVRRLGKRIVLALEGDLFLVLHLMIAGRLAWGERGARIPGKIGLAALDFATGTLVFREASTKKRASLHLVRGERVPEREGDGLPRGHGRPRALEAAVSRVRLAGAADRPRRPRDELLRALPDGRQAPRRSRPLEAPQAGLAEDARRARGAAAG